ncbi:MAG: TonB-dependent receptor [Gammaproteobacteria bacterium]|jgi:iron complex outermembrane recepter protein|nr:TonB-dependent receptor [Gammaproteobacteria bacterium]MBT4492812.1 TonB-dependent receptor [Gammaproteobacteria bacterium]MBT7370029.1 TonB-dependent receptor [Gammaproteobacteria bacterium]
MKNPYLTKLAPAALFTVLAAPTQVLAEQNVIEEIIVTARQQAETLQDVPVTVAAFSEQDLDRYSITSLEDAAKMVPNFYVNFGGSGNGSNLYLRGIGSTSISAAFDQSVALNIDGVVINQGRFIANAYLDMGQMEVLKGPQSLYFGKSATAGVVSITSNDPGQEFEAELMAGFAPEHDGTYWEGIISGPITENFGARLAIGTNKADEKYENITPGVAKRWLGDETVNARLTLVWEPTDNLKARLKYSYSEFNSDGPNAAAEEYCPDGTVQATTTVGMVLQGFDDCKLNGNTSHADLNPVLVPGNPHANGGVAWLEQETDMISVQLDWDFSDTLSLTSITSYTDLLHTDFDIYDYNVGVFGGAHSNSYESLAQEFRVASSYDGAFNFQAGLYYQDFDQEFHAWQYAANIGLLAADPVTGNGYDYDKHHYTSGKVKSVYVAGYWDVTDTVEVTAGVRYTEEEKDGHITIPYVHTFLKGTFAAPPLIEGLTFDDSNTSPEVAVNWHVTDNTSVFASYKEGFKSGGFDTSALPTASLNTSNPDFPEFLLFDSEEAEGFEVGVKSNLLDGSMRINASAFTYDYNDLQVQLFNSASIQYSTFNASKLTTTGAEMDLLWLTNIEGLSVRANLALTDTTYEDDFFNPDGQNMDGEDRERSADTAGMIGFTYDVAVGGNWRMDLSLDARFNSGYSLAATLNPYEQDSYWLTDAAIRLYSEDDRWEFALIGRNLGDEILAYSTGPRPGACVQTDIDNPDSTLRCKQFTQPVLAIEQDQDMYTSLGVQYMFQARFRF